MMLYNNTSIFCQTILKKDSTKLSSSNLKIKPPPNDSSVKKRSGLQGQNNSSSPDLEMAKKLAAELNNAGIQMSSNELNDLANAITKGGQGAIAVATMISAEIAKIKFKEPSEGNANSTTAKVKLSDKQLNEMIKKISTGKDSTLGISQFLKTKLSQVKKSQ